MDTAAPEEAGAPACLDAELVSKGLSAAQVAERTAQGQINRAADSSSRSIGQILRGNIFTLFNAMLSIAVVIILLVGNWRDAVAGVVLVCNAAIGILGELRAKRTLDKLAILAEAPAHVVRDGQLCDIPADQVVLGDVLVLGPGDQVVADAQVRSSTGLEVDESMLTGESDPVEKAAGDAVRSGSFAVAGSARLEVTAVGEASYAHRLTSEARRFSLVNSELRAGINTVLKWVSWIIVPVAMLLAFSQIRAHGGLSQSLADGSWREAIVGAMAGVIGMVPEGLVLLTSINFALAALILARRMVLVQELPAVEVLARVDTLCLDKTGTITDGHIALDRIEEVASFPADHWRAALAGLVSSDAANATSVAVQGAMAHQPALSFDAVVPFSSVRKWSAGAAGGQVWVLGAPEIVLAAQGGAPGVACTLERVTQVSDGGARVVLLAQGAGKLSQDHPALPARLEPVALIVLREQIRPDAPQTLAYFREQGVDLKVISGDNPATVAAIAASVGLGGSAGVQAMDARDLPDDPEALGKCLATHNVFGRVTPEQKRAMVRALQAGGHTVAMTGDGVNDALALKDADLGIAMGSGAPATKAVARLVLLDGKFSSLPGVVGEGRRVIANMERVSNLFLTKTTYAALLALCVAAIALPYPFLPRHMTAVGALTIGIPAFFLALAPNLRRYRPGFLGRVLRFAVPSGVVCALCVMSVYLWVRHANPGLASTAATLTLIAVGLWILGVMARPWNWWRVALVAAMVAIAVAGLAIPFVRDFFALIVPDGATFAAIAVVGCAGCLVVEAIHRLTRARRSCPAPAAGH